MANPIVLASSAHAVLAVFARLKKKAGDTLRYEDIFHALGDAQIARTGQRQLSRKGLVIEYEHSLELTPIGYAAIALSDRHTRESHVSDPCARRARASRIVNPNPLLPAPPDPGALYVLKRFTLKLGILLVFALAQTEFPWGFRYAFLCLTALSAIICVGLALVRKEVWMLARPNYWHEALAFCVIALAQWCITMWM